MESQIIQSPRFLLDEHAAFSVHSWSGSAIGERSVRSLVHSSDI